MQSNPSLPSLPGLLWPRVVAPDRVLSMGQIKLNCVLMLNWIVWNKTVFWHWNCVLMLMFEKELFWHITMCKQKTILLPNWIVSGRTVYMYKSGFGITMVYVP